MLVILFWVGVFLVGYTYLFYPLMIWLIGALRPKKVLKGDIYPTITVVIPAYNEERLIGKTVLNKLECDYPPGKREVIVISDSSTDDTDRIVASLNHPDIHLVRQEPRQGKTAALNKAVGLAKGEVIVFSDANSLYGKGALRRLAANFADPSVGYVTGRMGYVNPDGSGIAESCGAYMEYENLLRALETRCGSIVGVDGGIDAIRKELYVEMAPDMLPDFVLPLSVVERGYRVVYEPNAIVAEDALSSTREEFRMRVRVILRALHATWCMRRMFNPFRHGFFSLQLLSHKLLRYSVPFLLILLFVLNGLMVHRGGFWVVAFTGQCALYGVAALGSVLLRFRKKVPSVLFFPFYFVLVNYACLVAWVKFIRKKKQTLWTPRTG